MGELTERDDDIDRVPEKLAKAFMDNFDDWRH
jgi:hypothetical protein